MPTSTDLVTDLPADFAVFGQAVDTSMADLKGGTTGQILSKTSATDMDFTWITNDVGDITAVTAGTGISGGGTSGAVTVTNSMATAITTAGDVIQGTGSGTFARLGIGTAGQVLTVNSGATALEYGTPSAGVTPTYTLINSGGTTLSGSSVTISFSGYYNIWIHQAAATKSGGGTVYTHIRFNGDGSGTTNYTFTGGWGTTITGDNALGGTEFAMSGGTSGTGSMYVQNGQSTGRKPVIFTGYGSARSYIAGGFYNGAAALTSVTFTPDSGTFGGGTVFVYGY